MDSEALELKMTPLIDVIFQLLIFLMCALHFRSLETKLETFLPADKEIKKPLITTTKTRETIITLLHNDDNLMMPLIKMDGRSISDYRELTRQLENVRDTNKGISITIEPQARIPTQCVIDAIDACKKAGITPKLVPK